ncbi:MAG: glycosyltransferase family 4 protein [Proteobacteria bacterium]|nr:glycosyltransferase family 4 protein [Desulfobulbaceae bacterium]MBU4154126.1 glycosyltransferase family 4 protein [Pseudomonadota bacterium]MDP2105013.1 glycosyltransferase family 4 protein [Desulfobulbaceae bacterium]
MKIFVITGDKLNTGGGGITHLIETFEAIERTGNDIRLFAPQINFSSPLRVHRIFAPFTGLWGVIFFNLSLCVTLCRALIADRPDCIYTRQLSYSFVPPLLAGVFRVRHCLEVNGVLYDELQLINASPSRLALIKTISRINCALTDRISVTVQETKQRLITLYGTEESKIEIIPCDAANHQIFQPGDRKRARQALGLGEDDFIAGFVGTLYAWHGMDLFLAAIPQIITSVRNFRLVMVGDGVERERLISQARELKIERHVTFTGLIPYQQVPTQIQAFDVGISFFKPVRPIPGVPMKMYEYMACGIPVIASNFAGYGPVVSEIGAGLAVESQSPAEIAHAISALAGDPTQREAMAQKGRQAVEERFNWQRVGVEVENFIRRALC